MVPVVSRAGGAPDDVAVVPKSPNLTLILVRLWFFTNNQVVGESLLFPAEYIFRFSLFLSLSFCLSVVSFCDFSLTNFSLRVASLCILLVSFFLIYFARIDMIVGPPPPSTPRHKKYPTKGPMYSSKESPQYSPRLGFTKMPLSLEFFFFFHLLNVKPLSCQLYDGISHLAVQPAKS